jgi:GntR family transcriptional regulator
LVPGLLDLQLQDSLYDLLANTFRIRLERADQTITATVVEPEQAALLKVPAFSPAFNVQRTGYDARGRAIERAESLYRGDRYAYHVTLYRRDYRSQPNGAPPSV